MALIALDYLLDVQPAPKRAELRAAIREYQTMAGLKVTGEPSKALFDSLNEMRALMAPKPSTGAN